MKVPTIVLTGSKSLPLNLGLVHYFAGSASPMLSNDDVSRARMFVNKVVSFDFKTDSSSMYVLASTLFMPKYLSFMCPCWLLLM